MGATFSRLKNWIAEVLTNEDLNAEIDNILNNLGPAGVDDYSTNTAQMQSTADPGEVGSESLATTLAGEIQRLRQMIKEITGENQWYESPIASLLGLSNAIGSGITNNRLVSGRVRTNSQQPIFLVPNGAARTIKLDGTPTNFIYYIDGAEYTISTDVTLTNLTAAPSTNNTCLVNDPVAADQDWTKYTGENGTEIPVDTMGSEISALVGKFAAFSLNNGSATEYFTAYVASTTSLSKVRRGYFFDSSDVPIPRVVYTNNDTITLMKLSWIFAKTDGTLDVSYTNPAYGKDEPSSPAIGDYWFDSDNQTWKKYSGVAFAAASATLVGVCIQDTSNTVGARSFEFFLNYEAHNTLELAAESNTQVKTRLPGEVNVWGIAINNVHNLFTWDMTLDLDSGLVEASSTYYYFYLTEEGDKVISDIRPYDRRNDLQGFYHPHQSWRCIGYAFNNGSSNLADINSLESKGVEFRSTTALTAATYLDDNYSIIPVNSTGGAFAVHLPPAGKMPGHTFLFYKTNSAVSAVTVTPFTGETIAGASTKVLRVQFEVMKIRSDGTTWNLLSHNCPYIDSEIYLDTGNGHGSTNTRIRRYTNTRRDTTSPYMTYAESASAGASVTVNVAGTYWAKIGDRQGGATSNIGISVNSGTLTTAVQSVTYANGLRSYTATVSNNAGQTGTMLNLAVGDVIRPHTDGGADQVDHLSNFQVVLVKPKLGV